MRQISCLGWLKLLFVTSLLVAVSGDCYGQFPGGPPGGMSPTPRAPSPRAPSPRGPTPGYRPQRPSSPYRPGNQPGRFSPSRPATPGFPGASRTGPTYPGSQSGLAPGRSPVTGPGFRNPMTASRPTIPGAPGGINPRSSRFFPRPAASVPTRFKNVYSGHSVPTGGAWSQASQLISAGQTSQARQLIEKQLQGDRSLQNLMGAVSTLQSSSAGSLATTYRKEAMTVAQQQIRAGSTVPLPYAAVARFSLENGNDNVFRSTTSMMQSKFPEDKRTFYFTGIQHLKDHNYAEAQKALTKAGELGVPMADLNEYLLLAINGQKWVWEYAQIALVAIGVWAAGLLLIFVVGHMLSAASLRASKKLPVKSGEVTGFERRLRSAYRLIINMAGVYYYLSLPMIVLLSIALPLAIGYALLMLPSLSLVLIAVVLVAGAGGVITAISGIRALWLRRSNEDAPGIRLTEEQAPKLWAVLRDVAKQVGTRPIDEVWVMPGVDIAVAERGTYLQRMRDRGRRALLLGVGVLDGFRQQPFMSVLAHEYGHFAHRDTAGGDVAMRVQASMYAFADRIVARGRIRWWDVAVHFLRLYHRMFTGISFGASRLQEVLADRVAVTLYGAPAFKEGLTHVIHRSVEFNMQVNIAVGNRIRRSARPVGFYVSDQAFDVDEQIQVNEAIQQVMEAETSREDTHPSPSDRFALARQIDSCDSACADEFVWELFEDQSAITKAMSQRLSEYAEAEAQATREAVLAIIQQYDRHLSMQRDPGALLERSQLHARIGNYEKMKDDLEGVIQAVPDYYDAHYGLSVACEELGQFDDAVKPLQVVADNYKDSMKDFGFVYHLGRMQHLAGKSGDAEATLTRAIELNGNDAGAFLFRGRARAVLGSCELARTDFSRVLQILPNCREATMGLEEMVDIVATGTAE